MIGAIIGDIAGSRFEFNPTNDYNFELLSQGCSFTDDTICTVAIADAILRDGDYKSYIHDWCRRYPNPMGGYGNSFRKWVMSDNPQPYGSYGNGAAMRVSPVGLFYLNAFGMLPRAERTAACTHNHPEGIKGAQTVALAIHYALEMRGMFHDVSTKLIKTEILDKCVQFSGYDINIKKKDVQNKFDETCQGTVPVALWIIGKSKSFEDAIRRAVSLGADADTLGAIVGGIAEAIWGVPNQLALKALNYLPNEMKYVVLKFYSCLSHVENPFKGYGDEDAARDLLLSDGELQEEIKHEQEMREFQSIMLWKLGLGNMARYLNHEDFMPSKDTIATADTWDVEPMPSDNITEIAINISISSNDMEVIKRGHIPESQEDHWFMYCDDEHIRYFRSWTGACSFIAHFRKEGNNYIIDKLTINQALVEFGVNGDESAKELFLYLIATECGYLPDLAWQAYIVKWEKCNKKYAKKPERYNDTIDTWYVGTENHICDGCIYTNGIRQLDENKPKSEIAGCGRLTRKSFKERYESGKCEYRKSDLFVPSEFEKQKKEEALLKKKQKEGDKKVYCVFKDCKLAGSQYHDLDAVWNKLSIGTTLLLEREPENKYDKYAVKVIYQDNDYFHFLGYLPRTDNKEIALLLDMGWGEIFDCKISKMNSSAHPEEQVQLSVYIKKKNNNLK